MKALRESNTLVQHIVEIECPAVSFIPEGVDFARAVSKDISVYEDVVVVNATEGLGLLDTFDLFNEKHGEELIELLKKMDLGPEQEKQFKPLIDAAVAEITKVFINFH